MDTFSRRIKSLRLEAGWKQADLAEALHTSVSVISNYENGREPPYDILVQFAQYFGVTTDYLLGLSSTKQPDNGELLSTVNQAAREVERTGEQPVDAADVQALFAALTSYTDAGCSAGTLPIQLVCQLTNRMTALLTALNGGSVAPVLDASNALLQSVLNVSNVTTEYMKRNK